MNEKENNRKKYKIVIEFDVKLIYDFLEKKNLSMEEFSKLYSFDIEILRKILKNERNIPLYNIVKLSRIMNIDYEKFFIEKRIPIK